MKFIQPRLAGAEVGPRDRCEAILGAAKSAQASNVALGALVPLEH